MKQKSNNWMTDVLFSLDNFSERTAFVIQEKKYSYGQLKAMIASIMSEIPFQNKKIGIIGDDSIHTYAAILATLFSGNTYVILHPSYPNERNKKIISNAEITMILGAGDNPINLAGTDLPYLQIQEKVPSCDTIELKGKPSDLAYIIFTSGSTGEPKGVPISRANLDAFFAAYSKLGWKLNETDRMLQMFELTFDVSVVSLLYPLTIGASIYTVGHKDIKHFKVAALLEDEKLTFATLTPSLLQLLSPYYADIHLPDLKYLVVSAEASQTDTVGKFRDCAPNATFVNLYGPTETTIYCCCYTIPILDIKAYNGMVAIGKPFDGIQTVIVDENGNALEEGQQGELLVAGNQVMEGYYKNPEKTKEAITVRGDNKKYYRTGDLCIMDKEGDIFYCGRKDHQVKIQGFRIELSEIENAARSFFKGTRNAIALTYNEAGTGDALLLVIEGVENVDIEALENYMRENIPYYMIPRKILFLEKFPINNSNKIDRKKIKNIINY